MVVEIRGVWWHRTWLKTECGGGYVNLLLRRVEVASQDASAETCHYILLMQRGIMKSTSVINTGS